MVGRLSLTSEVDDVERINRRRNEICSELLLRALRFSRGEAPLEPEPAPEPISRPPNFTEEVGRGFSEVIRVLRAVSAYTGVPISEIKSERREHRVLRPRQYTYYLSKKLTVSSLPAIGRQLGDKDHTCVIAGVRRMEQLRKTDPKIESDLQAIAASLGGSLA